MRKDELQAELKRCREIERQLNLKNAELQIEIERSRYSESILRESCQILTLVSEISKDIVESGNELNIREILEKIGRRLHLNKIFLLRFSNTIEQYMEWCNDNEHSAKVEVVEDLTQLMNWVYEKKCFSGYAKDLPKSFNIISCPKDNDKCKKCNLILIPIIIERKPWGIMGYAKQTTDDAADLTKKSLKNLSNLVSILIKDKERTDHLSDLIDERLESFKTEINMLKR